MQDLNATFLCQLFRITGRLWRASARGTSGKSLARTARDRSASTERTSLETVLVKFQLFPWAAPPVRRVPSPDRPGLQLELKDRLRWWMQVRYSSELERSARHLDARADGFQLRPVRQHRHGHVLPCRSHRPHACQRGPAGGCQRSRGGCRRLHGKIHGTIGASSMERRQTCGIGISMPGFRTRARMCPDAEAPARFARHRHRQVFR